VFKKKQVLAIVSIAVISFLIGTTLNVMATDSGGNPWDKIWEALNNLQGRVKNIEGAINEISRVELVRNITSTTGFPEFFVYTYLYGVSGHWNISKLQNEPIIEKVNSTLSGALHIRAEFNAFTTWRAWQYTSNPFDPEELKGYQHGIQMTVLRELTETEIENIRSIIQEYLAKP